LRLEGAQETREGNGDYEVEEPARRRCKGHSDITNLQRICLGGIRERNWAFSEGVPDGVKVDTEGYYSDACLRVVNPEAESSE